MHCTAQSFKDSSLPSFFLRWCLCEEKSLQCQEKWFWSSCWPWIFPVSDIWLVKSVRVYCSRSRPGHWPLLIQGMAVAAIGSQLRWFAHLLPQWALQHASFTIFHIPLECKWNCRPQSATSAPCLSTSCRLHQPGWEQTHADQKFYPSTHTPPKVRCVWRAGDEYWRYLPWYVLPTHGTPSDAFPYCPLPLCSNMFPPLGHVCLPFL